MTSIETYVRYEDVFGTSSTMEQLETVLRSLDLGLVLRIFGPINTICSRRGLPNHDAAQAGLIRELFDESTIQRIRGYFESQGRLVTVFHRKQCLFIMREAMRLCPDLPGMDPNQIKEELAALSLMANEHASATAHRGPVSADSFVTMMCDFIPITEANELKFDIASISRMHKIIHDIAPARAASKPFFEVPALFQTASGISLETYEALSLAVLPRILKSAEDVLTHSPHYGVGFDYFSQTKLALKDRDVFFSLLARTPEQFRARLQNTTPGLSDFTVFKETPFLQNPYSLVPLDTTGCMERFEAAVFWTIFASLPEKEKKLFPSFWAALFEDYIDWLFENSVDGRLNRFYASPRYLANNQDEVCDGLVISGTTAVFIESKGGFIRGDAKYGGDPAVLKAEIDKKYVDPNGVFQIARSIAKALRQPNRPLIRDVDLSGIRTVIPLLVTRDDVGDGFFVNSYLNSRFDEIRQTSNLNREIAPVHCTKLISVSVDIAEKLSPYLVDTRIGEILAGRLMADPLLLTPFFIKPPPCIVSKGDRPPTLLRSLQPELSRLAAKFLEVSSPESE